MTEVRRRERRTYARKEYRRVYEVLQSLEEDDAPSLAYEIQLGYDAVRGDGTLSVLHHCVTKNSYECLKYLLETCRVSPNLYDNNFRGTPLHLAINNNKPQIAQLLIVNGADLQCRDFNGVSPLELLSRLNSPEWEKLLLFVNSTN